MFRPRGFADLTNRRVGVYGLGVEGRATVARLATVTTDVVLVDDAPSDPTVLATDHGGLDALLTCDVVLKSPGIPRRSAAVTALEAAAVTVTSALNLWLNDTDRERVIAVTGTKGKSTTTSLIAFFLECLGERAHRVGNIGQPPYDPALDLSTGWIVVEMSSFQCVDIETAPARIVLTSLGADHLDWHGSLEQYHADKLSLTRSAGPHDTFVADSPSVLAAHDQIGGTLHVVPADDHDLAAALRLLGDHSHSNVALALAVVAHATGRTVAQVAEVVRGQSDAFTPLRGRLTLVATADGVRYVDDGLATAVLPTVAALTVFAADPLSIIVGGFDRGVDYQPLVDALRTRTAPVMVVALGPAGQRIHELLLATDVSSQVVADMANAVREARSFVADGGVVLLSPAAPSFDAYRNWEERSADFARWALTTDL